MVKTVIVGMRELQTMTYRMKYPLRRSRDPAPAETTARIDAACFGWVGWLERLHTHLPCYQNEVPR
jgi:hypothetical protein